jgi:Tfp pilus assembly protein PilF
MRTSVRVLVLCGAAAAASLAIAVGYLGQRPATTETTAGAEAPHTDAAMPSTPSLGENDSPFASGRVASRPDAAPVSTDTATRGARTTNARTATGSGGAPADSITQDAARRARQRVRDARQSLAGGHAAEAEAQALEAVELAPQNGGAWNVLGRTQLALGQLDEAETSFARACEVDSGNAWARNNLGWLCLQRGEWVEAATFFEQAIARQPEVASFHNNLGAAYEHAGRLAEASGAYARALQLEPKHAMARIAMTRVTARLQPSLAAALPADSSASDRTSSPQP